MLGIYRQRMSLGVEDKLVEWNKFRVVRKQEIEIFQCLSEPEALHLVTMLWAGR